MFISSAYAQAAPAAVPAPGAGFGVQQLLLFGGMFVVMYFLMIRPQMKRAKEQKAMIEALAKGDEVVFGGGLLGKVTKLSESFLHVEVASGVELQIQRSAVVQVLPKGSIK